MYLQKLWAKKLEKNYFLLVSWCHWRKDQDPVPDPDPIVRGTDTRIRIVTKMSRIQNTRIKCKFLLRIAVAVDFYFLLAKNLEIFIVIPVPEMSVKVMA
jgi:hypothetical protein